MAVLNDEVKLAIVQALACFDTPSQAAETVSQQFGISVDGRQAEKYDPTSTEGRNLRTWASMASAVNQGQSGVRGPPQLVVARIGTSSAAVATGTVTLVGGTDDVSSVAATSQPAQACESVLRAA